MSEEYYFVSFIILLLTINKLINISVNFILNLVFMRSFLNIKTWIYVIFVFEKENILILYKYYNKNFLPNYWII